MILSMRQLWPLIFALCIVLYCSSNAVQAQDSGASEPDEDALSSLEQFATIIQEHPDVQETILAEEPVSRKDERPGAAQYEEAMAILETIQPPRRRLARYTKPTSVLGSLGYYAKELFSLLFMNSPEFDYKTSKGSRKTSEPLAKAVVLLKEAGDEGHEDAIFKLAEMNFFGQHTYPRNFSAAFENYQDLVRTDGNSTAQHMLGFMYATGIGGVAKKDQARALLYHTFAADGGDIRARMTTAFRHHAGIGTPRDCQKAVVYYKQVADQAMAYARSGPPGGQQMVKEAHRLADDNGGVYGEGASAISSGDNAKHTGPTHDTNAAFDDVLEYLDLMSRKGELKAIFSLGRLHYEGSRALQRNYRIAADKFLDVARRYWDRKGKVRSETEYGVDKLASQAAGYLGRMFLRGEGFEQNFQIARVWFKRGIENGDALCQYSMGLIYLHGLGVPRDAIKAAEYFSAAADQDFATAQVRLGALFMDQGDLITAVKYFKLAERKDHVEALYYLGEMAHQGVGGQDRSCNQAALYYKKVAEKAEQLHSNFGEANDAYEEGDLDTALLLYMMGAEQGYEAGQANVAYLLDRTIPESRSHISSFLSRFKIKIPFSIHIPFITKSARPTPKSINTIDPSSLALIYWTRSAKQANIDSLLKMGDYYLAGLGVPSSNNSTSQSPLLTSSSDPSSKDNSTAENAARAAACYAAAAETLSSAQALFNLGWMHENGIGLEQDFHLAKRYYDAATEPPMKEARTPVALALLKLRARSWWNGVTGGSINSIREDESKKKRKTFWQWFGEFVAADLELYGDEGLDGAGGAGDDAYLDEWGETFNGGGGAGGDEWEDLDGGLLETAFIIALAGVLALLVWYRQMAAMRERVRQERAAGANAGGGGGAVNTGAGAGGVNAGAGGSASNVTGSNNVASNATAGSRVGGSQSQSQSQSQEQGEEERQQQQQQVQQVQQEGEGQGAGGEGGNAWAFPQDTPNTEFNPEREPEPGRGRNWDSGVGGIGH